MTEESEVNIIAMHDIHEVLNYDNLKDLNQARSKL